MNLATLQRLLKLASSPILFIIVAMIIIAHQTHKAREEERALCNKANLEAQLAEAGRQLAASAKVIAEEKANADAREKEALDLEAQVHNYEILLTAKPPSDSCLLSADDVKRLRGLAP